MYFGNKLIFITKTQKNIGTHNFFERNFELISPKKDYKNDKIYLKIVEILQKQAILFVYSKSILRNFLVQ